MNQCPVLVVVFLLVFYIAGNQYQTESKHRETFCGFFMDQKTSSGPEKHLGVPRGGHKPPGHAWGPRRALVGCAPLGAPPKCCSGPSCVLVHKNSPRSFAVFGLRLILIFCDVKDMQKPTTATWHYVNRLVPKNDINLL